MPHANHDTKLLKLRQQKVLNIHRYKTTKDILGGIIINSIPSNEDTSQECENSLFTIISKESLSI